MPGQNNTEPQNDPTASLSDQMDDLFDSQQPDPNPAETDAPASQDVVPTGAAADDPANANPAVDVPTGSGDDNAGTEVVSTGTDLTGEPLTETLVIDGKSKTFDLRNPSDRSELRKLAQIGKAGHLHFRNAEKRYKQAVETEKAARQLLEELRTERQNGAVSHPKSQASPAQPEWDAEDEYDDPIVAAAVRRGIARELKARDADLTAIKSILVGQHQQQQAERTQRADQAQLAAVRTMYPAAADALVQRLIREKATELGVTMQRAAHLMFATDGDRLNRIAGMTTEPALSKPQSKAAATTTVPVAAHQRRRAAIPPMPTGRGAGTLPPPRKNELKTKQDRDNALMELWDGNR